ncbi:hypothetical protein FACS1894180_6680 [Bacteroidia bacterium]|nr:hypothetical protein FACS1894180_6680 [Bacteroidia bacterium]
MLAASNALWSQYKAFSDLDSLKKVVDNAQTEPRERIDALSRIAKTCMLLQDSVNSRKFMQQARALSAKEGGRFAIFVHSQQLQCLMLAPQINPKNMYAEIDTLNLLIDKTGDNEMKAMGCYNIGAAKFILNDNSATQDGFSGLSFAQKMDDRAAKFSIMYELYKLLYFSTGEQKYSDEMLKYALKSGDKNQIATVYQRIASSFAQKFRENPETDAFADSAFIYINKAREIIKQNPHKTLYNTYYAVMQTYVQMLLFDAPNPQNVNKAKQLVAEYEQTIKNKTFLDSETHLLDLYFWVYMQAEDYANAEKTVLKNIDLQAKTNYQQSGTMENLYYNLYNIYRQTGEPEKALDALSECLNWNQVSFNTEKTVITETAAAKYGLEKKEQELKIANLQKMLILAVCILLIVVSVLLVRRFIKRNKKLLKHTEYQNYVIEKNQKETLTMHANLERKKHVFEKLKTTLQSDEGIQNAKMILKSEQKKEKSKEKDIQELLNSLSPNFYAALQQQAGSDDLLTSNDLKYCCCILLNIGNNEIAQMMGISPDSVRTHKYRLKQKLKLLPPVSLEKFIRETYHAQTYNP